MSCRHAIAAAALLVGFAARAEDGMAEWGEHAISQDALTRMRGAVEAQIGFGYGTFTDTSTRAFASGTGPAANSWFGGGNTIDLEAVYRWRRFGLGLEANWYNLTNDVFYTFTSPTQGDNFSAGDYAVFERVYLTPPGRLLEASFDLSEGYGSFTNSSILQDRTSASTSFSAFVFGGRLQAGVRPFSLLPGLRFGGFLVASAWSPLGCSSTGGYSACPSPASFGPNVALSGGLFASFALPVRSARSPEYVLVTAQRAPPPEGPAADVLDTDAFRQRRAGIHQIALAAPSSCEPGNGGTDQGRPPDEHARLRARCALETAEVERALLKQGFEVTSWQALDALVRSAQLTPVEAAARSGAQVLLRINALERVAGDRPASGLGESRIFASDSDGSQGAPVVLPEGERSTLRQIAEQAIVGNKPTRRVGARIDVEAVGVPTGEPLWSFREQKMDSGSASPGTSVVARRNEDDDWVLGEAPGASDTPMGGEVADGVAEQARYYRLLRDVVGECVQHFAHPTR